jgi:two-component system phosphate regulon sensor histidine kinase PhoR
MLLIGACVFTVLALALIQGYFIYNTYKLTEKEVAQAVKKQLTDLEDNEEWISINNTWMDQTGDFTNRYVNKEVSKAAFEKFIERNSDSLSAALTNFMAKKAKPGDFKVGYSVYMTSVTLLQKGNPETLYDGRLLIMKNKKINGEDLFLSSARWENKLQNETVDYNLIVKSERCYNMENWKMTIFQKMASLLIFSFVLMAFVVFLYYMSLKNLVSQKRIADVKTDFVNNLTHEFQTPLATMDIAIKTLQRKDSQMNTAHYQHTLAMIERQNDRLQKLFRQVTEASINPVASNESIKISCSEIKEMIEDFKISKPNVSIECFQKNEKITVSMDRFHLNTILTNLLDNAVKYDADNIEIELKSDVSTFYLEVKDNGKGIPFKEQDSIFDKFYRIEKGNIHNTKGLGLGLFYIKQLVETYKGQIKVESKEGNGAVFLIAIPI